MFHRRHAKWIVFPLFASSAVSAPAADNDTAASADNDASEIVIVVGTRTERALSDTAATVSVRTAEDIERELTRDIADLVRFEPGVSVAGTGSRFGLSGFNIRGIGGNRVLTVVDNVRVPEEFSFGPFLDARRDFVDVDVIDRVEIGRGPVSALYGSDALGGVVAVTTLKPFDLVSEEDPLYGRFRTGYSSADESFMGTANLAFGDDSIAGLLTITRREGEETNTAGGFGGTGFSREQPDPVDIQTTNVDAKFSFVPSEGHELTVNVFRLDSENDSIILSDANTVSRGVLTTDRVTEDARERTGWSLDYRYTGEATLIDDLQLKVYSQSSDTEQLTFDERVSFSSGPQSRRRRSVFEQEIQGLYGQVSKAFTTGAMSHYVTLGLDIYNTDNTSLRDGGTVDFLGNPVPEFTPLPTRDFPQTEVEQRAFFIQDEISLLNDRLLLSPGLRFDTFDADASADAIYLAGNPGSATPEDYNDSEVTFKLGAVYKLTDEISVYGRFSEGFRAPPFDDVNVGFTNFVGGYKTIANPDLESETSTGFELGARWISPGLQASVAVYQNDYKNFIEPLATAPQFAATFGVDPADGLFTFQSVNRADVEITGVELTADARLGEFVPALEGFRVRAAIAYADGEDQERGEALNTVEPLNGVLGVGYQANSGRWGLEGIWTAAAGKDEDDIDSESPRFASDGYGILDLIGYFQITERVMLNAGVFNVTDKNYVRWVDTAGIGIPGTAGFQAPGRFAQPSLNYAINLRVDL
ncbi:MAG: TonB-dependent hemoglobin/transferrin/lactoferrin family receptor [Pseudomonadota bacterium]